ncbi:nucleotidyltransferase family protein [Nocardia tengchongensis]|uniref:hypothetical protein n=1 Tax=Nocardia tengchongensis TaxID=2055889 RepID=UPI00364920E1
MQLDEQPPWSANKLKKLGKAIREGREQDAAEPSYNDFVVWYDELQASVQTRLREIDFSPLLGEQQPNVTGRPKTIDTLREKLISHPTWALPSIYDIAGVRIEARMNLLTQSAVARKIATELGCDYLEVSSDSRSEPHSGYRGLHLRLILPAGRVEVQIRTSLQGEWANLYEEVADIFGRAIRYGVLPADAAVRVIILQIQSMSAAIERYEVVSASLETADDVWSQTAPELRAQYRAAILRNTALSEQIIATLAACEGIDAEIRASTIGSARSNLSASTELRRPSRLDNEEGEDVRQASRDLEGQFRGMLLDTRQRYVSFRANWR